MKAHLQPGWYILAVLAVSLYACSNHLLEQVLGPKTVSFESNGGTPVASQLLFKGQTVRYPLVPEKEGAAFDRWYEDNHSFTQPWNFTMLPSADITLYAKWIEGSEGEPPPDPDPDTLTRITITAKPRLTYLQDSALDLSGAEVRLEYSDGSSEDVAFVNFEDKHITAEPEHGTILSRKDHHGRRVRFSIGTLYAATQALIIRDGVGDGSQDNPHLIDNSSDTISLQDIGNKYPLDDHYELADDIIWDGIFQPIGSDNDQFTGSFNGNGYSISNIIINNPEEYQGMFAEIAEGAVVKNFALTIVEIPTAHRADIGAVTAANYGTIENVYVSGKIGRGTVSVGSIAGNNFGLIRNCFVAVTNMNAGTNVGGIAGINGNGGRIEHCIALNDKIEAPNTGRITGSLMGTGTVSNNYAWDAMDIVTAAVSREPVSDPNGKDGESVSIDQLKIKATWEKAGFDFSGADSLWQWNGGAGLPSFHGGEVTEWSPWLYKTQKTP